MTSIVEKLREIKDFICLQGKSGIKFDTVRVKFSLSAVLGEYVLKHLESDPNYCVSSLTNASGVVVIASQSERCVALGIKSPNDVPFEAAFNLLELIAVSGVKGIPAPEVISIMKIKSPPFDKLLVLGLIEKRVVMPRKALTPSKRILSRTTIYHLKRFANLYDPVSMDGAYFEMNDNDLQLIMKHIGEVLIKEKKRFMPISQVYSILGIKTKHMANFRSKILDIQKKYEKQNQLMFFELKDENGVDLSGATSENKMKSPVSKLRSAWCVGYQPPPGVVDDRLDTVQNPLDFHFDYKMEVADFESSPVGSKCVRNLSWLNQAWLHTIQSMRDGMSSNMLRDGMGIHRKRSQRLAIDLVNIYKFLTIKSQEGKQAVYRIYGEDGYKQRTEGVTMMPIAPAASAGSMSSSVGFPSGLTTITTMTPVIQKVEKTPMQMSPVCQNVATVAQAPESYVEAEIESKSNTTAMEIDVDTSENNFLSGIELPTAPTMTPTSSSVPSNVSYMFASSDSCWSNQIFYSEPGPNTANVPMVSSRVVDPISDIIMRFTYKHAGWDMTAENTESKVAPNTIHKPGVSDSTGKRFRKRMKTIGQSLSTTHTHLNNPVNNKAVPFCNMDTILKPGYGVTSSADALNNICANMSIQLVGRVRFLLTLIEQNSNIVSIGEYISLLGVKEHEEGMNHSADKKHLIRLVEKLVEGGILVKVCFEQIVPPTPSAEVNNTADLVSEYVSDEVAKGHSLGNKKTSDTYVLMNDLIFNSGETPKTPYDIARCFAVKQRELKLEQIQWAEEKLQLKKTTLELQAMRALSKTRSSARVRREKFRKRYDDSDSDYEDIGLGPGFGLESEATRMALRISNGAVIPLTSLGSMGLFGGDGDRVASDHMPEFYPRNAIDAAFVRVKLSPAYQFQLFDKSNSSPTGELIRSDEPNMPSAEDAGALHRLSYLLLGLVPPNVTIASQELFKYMSHYVCYSEWKSSHGEAAPLTTAASRTVGANLREISVPPDICSSTYHTQGLTIKQILALPCSYRFLLKNCGFPESLFGHFVDKVEFYENLDSKHTTISAAYYTRTDLCLLHSIVQIDPETGHYVSMERVLEELVSIQASDVAAIMYGHVVSNLLIHMCFIKSIGLLLTAPDGAIETQPLESSAQCTRELIELFEAREMRLDRLKAHRLEFMNTRKVRKNTSNELFFDTLKEHMDDICCSVHALWGISEDSSTILESASETNDSTKSIMSFLEESFGNCASYILDIRKFEYDANMFAGGQGQKNRKESARPSIVGLFGTFRLKADAAIEKYWTVVLDGCFNELTVLGIANDGDARMEEEGNFVGVSYKNEYVYAVWKLFYQSDIPCGGRKVTTCLYSRIVTDSRKSNSVIPKTAYSNKQLKNQRICFARKLNSNILKNERPRWLKDRFHLNARSVGQVDTLDEDVDISRLMEVEWCSGSEWESEEEVEGVDAMPQDEVDHRSENVSMVCNGQNTFSGIFGSVENVIASLNPSAVDNADNHHTSSQGSNKCVERSMRSVLQIEKWWNQDNDIALMKEILRLVLVKRVDGIPKRLLPSRDDSTRVLKDDLFKWWEESIFDRLLQYGACTTLPTQSNLHDLLSEYAVLDSALHSVCVNIPCSSSCSSPIEITKRSTVVRIVYGRDVVRNGSEKVNALLVRFVNRKIAELLAKYDNVYKMVLYVLTADAEQEKTKNQDMSVAVNSYSNIPGFNKKPVPFAKPHVHLTHPSSVVGTVARGALFVSQYAHLKEWDREHQDSSNCAKQLLHMDTELQSQPPKNEWKSIKTRTILRTKLLQIYFCISELLQIRSNISDKIETSNDKKYSQYTNKNSPSAPLDNYYLLDTIVEVDEQIKRRIEHFNDFMSGFDGFHSNCNHTEKKSAINTNMVASKLERCEMESWWYEVIVEFQRELFNHNCVEASYPFYQRYRHSFVLSNRVWELVHTPTSLLFGNILYCNSILKNTISSSDTYCHKHQISGNMFLQSRNDFQLLIKSHNNVPISQQDEKLVDISGVGSSGINCTAPIGIPSSCVKEYDESSNVLQVLGLLLSDNCHVAANSHVSLRKCNKWGETDVGLDMSAPKKLRIELNEVSSSDPQLNIVSNTSVPFTTVGINSYRLQTGEKRPEDGLGLPENVAFHRNYCLHKISSNVEFSVDVVKGSDLLSGDNAGCRLCAGTNVNSRSEELNREMECVWYDPVSGRRIVSIYQALVCRILSVLLDKPGATQVIIYPHMPSLLIPSLEQINILLECMWNEKLIHFTCNCSTRGHDVVDTCTNMFEQRAQFAKVLQEKASSNKDINSSNIDANDPTFPHSSNCVKSYFMNTVI